MLWRMQQRGINQSQGFQVIYILLHSYVYLCLPTYYRTLGLSERILDLLQN
ncbi:hypothetical protein Aazo_1516 ['Nostoc azollae' 0708]|uniref:Uncharacterized protein n=1 Tax=Nostoc azollae (strain 0708) TaxID=551115 RepID=D7E4G2_NOSA0|nr:hypothetical protein Aazo_1516 ['Nostoc azollae' 0708]